MGKKTIVFNQIDLDEADENIGKEVMIILRNGDQYFGILRDIDDDELVLSRPDQKVSLGFQLSWITLIAVKEE